MIELWTISAMVGTVAAVYGIRESVLDLAYLRGLNGQAARLRLIGSQRLFAMIVRALIEGGWTIIGALYWLQGLDTTITATGLVLVMGNVGLTAVTVTDVLVSRLVRSRLSGSVYTPPESTPE